MLRQKSENSIDPKSHPFGTVREDYRDFSEEMNKKLEDYILSLHGICEDSRTNYKSQVRTLARFLTKRGIERFEDASSKDIDLFLSGYQKDSTRNVYIVRVKHLYSKFLKLPDLVQHLKISNTELPPVTPSELLTPEEIVKLANASCKRRELYKVVILVAFESCAMHACI